ncbi:MAG: hypothetical protein CEN89_330 [Candidatus Berkelbacteria bacterium Licking1014_7]|uniref:Uncharacterized protein n=1 Tax=Candidatus Berkelbacteria bacterium Licking1014_7 TaxID=2017147 RepID=A0A554LJA9_9BACT|nr:MAG: hypothetical protein CEN89_330 [Candidatus Berkelbacteria bacterium Licking1014_7]
MKIFRQNNQQKKGKRQGEDFYQDIDARSKKKRYCTCSSLMMVFVALFVLGALGIFWLFNALSKSNLAPERRIAPSTEALESYQTKLSEIIAQAFLNKEAGVKENVRLIITEEELTSILAQQGEELSKDRVSIKNLSIIIKPAEMEVFGEMVKPINSKIKIGVLPSAKNGSLDVAVKWVEAGRIKLPSFVAGELNKIIEAQIDEIVKKGSITYIEEINLLQGEIEIMGRMR